MIIAANITIIWWIRENNGPVKAEFQYLNIVKQLLKESNKCQ